MWEPIDEKGVAHQEQPSREWRVEPDRPLRVAPSSPSRIAARPLRVLCVENSIVSYGLVHVLNELFGTVNERSVRSIADLLEFAAGGEKFDIVLLDARVPDIDNFDGLKRAVSSLPDACFIVTSPDEDEAGICSAIRAGARGFIPMSSRVDVLRYALPLIICGEIYVPASAFRSASRWSTANEPPRMIAATRGAAADALTRRQSEVLLMLAVGKSNKEIARHLNLLDGTVKLHVRAILRKLSVNNRTQAVMAAARAGYLPEDLLGIP
jgi:DNA-binding NarL/FixJ family response regulator